MKWIHEFGGVVDRKLGNLRSDVRKLSVSCPYTARNPAGNDAAQQPESGVKLRIEEKLCTKIIQHFALRFHASHQLPAARSLEGRGNVGWASKLMLRVGVADRHVGKVSREYQAAH